MAFLDSDPVEDHLGKSVDQMTSDELAAYMRIYLELRHGVAPPLDGLKERAVFGALQRFYGQADAGRIVKWATWRYDGRYRGSNLGYFSFSKKMRWLTDLMLMELHDHLRKTAYDKPCTQAHDFGFASGEDLL